MDVQSEVAKARVLNIIDMAVGFTRTLRVFKAGSGAKIKAMVREFLGSLSAPIDRKQFELLHVAFCRQFSEAIRLSKKDAPAAYGHGAKMLDVCLKACVHYCSLPDDATAQRVRPMLHTAIDSPILKYLKRRHGLNVCTDVIAGIDADAYAGLQDAVQVEIAQDFGGAVLPVELDDLLWRRLNRS